MKLSELVKISDPVEVKRRFEKYRGGQNLYNNQFKYYFNSLSFN